MTEINSVVLVVDDEVQIPRFLRAGLELDGFTVQDAETGGDERATARAWPHRTGPARPAGSRQLR